MSQLNLVHFFLGKKYITQFNSLWVSGLSGKTQDMTYIILKKGTKLEEKKA